MSRPIKKYLPVFRAGLQQRRGRDFRNPSYPQSIAGRRNRTGQSLVQFLAAGNHAGLMGIGLGLLADHEIAHLAINR